MLTVARLTPGTTEGFAGGAWSGDFVVTAAAMAQLAALNTSYPIKYDLSLDGNDDANVPVKSPAPLTQQVVGRARLDSSPRVLVQWLAPGRLLIFIKYRPLLNDTFNATVR